MNTMLIAQNLTASTLVGGKSTAVRLFASSPDTVSQIDRVQATILRPDGSRIVMEWGIPPNDNAFVAIPKSSYDFVGPSVVVTIPGRQIPWVGVYYIRAQTFHGQQVVAIYDTQRIELLPTKDVRFLVYREWSGTATLPGELEAGRRAMERLASLYPVRDGISILDGDRTAGLRYNLYDNAVPADANYAGLIGQWRHRPDNLDSIDLAVAYRRPNASDNYQSGARSGWYVGDFQYSNVVWSGFMANVFCQETGHCLGLEPPQDPHIDPGHQHAHSLDTTVNPVESGLGYNVGDQQELPNPTYDLMHWIQLAPDDDSIALNSWDWEFLRQQLVKLPSTGPTGTFLSWRNLEGTDLMPALAVNKNANGRQFVAVLGGDQAIYYRQEGEFEGWWDPWTGLQGHGLRAPIRIAKGADGRLYVFALGGDGKIYVRSQMAPSGAWRDWQSVGGDQIKNDYAVSPNADGRLEILAVWGGGSLHSVAQTSPDGTWGSWDNRGGRDLAGPVAVGANADGSLQLFALGGDGIVYYQWQLNVNGTAGWSAWSTLNGPDGDHKTQADVLKALPKCTGMTVKAAADGRLYIFLVKTDQHIAYQSQNRANSNGQDWSWPTELNGPLLNEPSALSSCAVEINPDGRLEIFVVAQDHSVYNIWQIDASKPDAWSEWTNLGGRNLQSALQLGKDDDQEINVFVIGGDNMLYYSDRGIEPTFRRLRAASDEILRRQILSMPPPAIDVLSFHEGKKTVRLGYGVITSNGELPGVMSSGVPAPRVSSPMPHHSSAVGPESAPSGESQTTGT